MAIKEFIPTLVEDDYWAQIGMPHRGNALLKAIDVGLPYTTIRRFSDRINMDVGVISVSAGISSATLARRAKVGRFKPQESDGLHRMAEVYRLAEALFENDEKLAQSWMTSPVKALGGRKPIDMMQTSAEAGEVLNVIGRLEHGVFT